MGFLTRLTGEQLRDIIDTFLYVLGGVVSFWKFNDWLFAYLKGNRREEIRELIKEENHARDAIVNQKLDEQSGQIREILNILARRQ